MSCFLCGRRSASVIGAWVNYSGTIERGKGNDKTLISSTQSCLSVSTNSHRDREDQPVVVAVAAVVCSSYEEGIHHSSPSSSTCLSKLLLSSFWATTLLSSVDPPDSEPTPSFVASVDIAAVAVVVSVVAAVVAVDDMAADIAAVVGGNSC